MIGKQKKLDRAKSQFSIFAGAGGGVVSGVGVDFLCPHRRGGGMKFYPKLVFVL